MLYIAKFQSRQGKLCSNIKNKVFQNHKKNESSKSQKLQPEVKVILATEPVKPVERVVSPGIEGIPETMPEAPTTCCMSGCPNCVWLDYAEKLCRYFRDGGDQAMKELQEKITDDNIKAFIMHEWRMRQKEKDN